MIFIYMILKLQKILKKLKIEEEFYLEKYNENEIIAYSKYDYENDLLIFSVEGSDIIKSCEI